MCHFLSLQSKWVFLPFLRCELSVAQAKVARLERKRLEERAKAGAAPMELEDAISIDGRPQGEEGQPRGDDASSKRARVSPPETG